MFHKDFYPTPIDVVRSMIPTELFSPKMWVSYKVLEPSAWKWDILDYINWITKYKKVRLYAIEQSPELQSILKEKQYKVVHDDFLTFNTYKMKTIAVSEFRKNIKKYADLASKEQIIVNRGEGKAFAIVPINELEDKGYDPKFVAKIMKSKEDSKQGRVTFIKTEDLWK